MLISVTSVNVSVFPSLTIQEAPVGRQSTGWTGPGDASALILKTKRQTLWSLSSCWLYNTLSMEKFTWGFIPREGKQKRENKDRENIYFWAAERSIARQRQSGQWQLMNMIKILVYQFGRRRFYSTWVSVCETYISFNLFCGWIPNYKGWRVLFSCFMELPTLLKISEISYK